MSPWLLVALGAFGVGVALWTVWGLLNIVSNCNEYWQAAREGEDARATEGKGSC